ncbi:MAG: hypothetical protein AAF125_14380, partial [Chloroflexota bacterium]
MRIKPTALVLFSLAALIGAVLAVLFLAPIPRTTTIDRAGAEGTLTAARGFLPASGDCTTVQWDVNNIVAVYFNGEGVVGRGSRDVCITMSEQPTLTVEFTDGTATDYPVPSALLLNSNGIWGAGLLAAVALIAALIAQIAPTPTAVPADTERQARPAGALVSVWNAATAITMSLLLTALLLEGAFRIYVEAFSDERDRLIYTGTAEEIAEANSTSIGMPFVNFGGIPGKEGINALGFRGELVEVPKPDETYRILALGGSTTYGLDVPPEEAYPAQLERILREEYGYSNVEVVNGGFLAYTTMNSLVNFMTRGIELEPDMVIVYHAVNDLVKRWDQPDCFSGQNPLYGFGGDPGYWDDQVDPLNPSVA